MPGGSGRGGGSRRAPVLARHGPDSVPAAIPRSGSWTTPWESWGRLQPRPTAATSSPGHWGKRMGEGFLPRGAAREPGGAGSIPVWGARESPRAAPWKLSLPMPPSPWPGPPCRRRARRWRSCGSTRS